MQDSNRFIGAFLHQSSPAQIFIEIVLRSGCFCPHPYVIHLLQLPNDRTSRWREQMLAGDKSEMPGMVRASFGCYSNTDDVDRLVEMLHRIARGDYHGDYILDRASGEYTPRDFHEPLEEYFLLEALTG